MQDAPAPASVSAHASVPALEARHLSLSWDGVHLVVADINLVVGRAELVCMVGRSGCGKTTILHALSGLSKPLEGQVLLHGNDLGAVQGKVSYMFQKDLLLPSKRVLDNVCLPLVIAGVPPAQAREKARPLMERFGLTGTEAKWPSELSGGMRQRAAFLRTYLMGNDVMLLDEPFSALDAITRKDVREWFARMVSDLGISVLMITHDVDEAAAMAERIYVLGGDPAAGEASHIQGEIMVDRRGVSDGSDFELTDAFLAAKRQVLTLLG